jgi:hypothetical protein
VTLAYLKLPVHFQINVRMIKNLFEGTREEAMELVFVPLVRTPERWRGVSFLEPKRQRLKLLRRESGTDPLARNQKREVREKGAK